MTVWPEWEVLGDTSTPDCMAVSCRSLTTSLTPLPLNQSLEPWPGHFLSYQPSQFARPRSEDTVSAAVAPADGFASAFAEGPGDDDWLRPEPPQHGSIGAAVSQPAFT